MSLKLGKLAPKPAPLRLAAYAAALPDPPAVAGDLAKFDGQMYANDRLGCCAIAGPAHETRHWLGLIGRDAPITDDQVISVYSQVTGYDPADPSTDQGSVVADVVKFRRTVGFPDAAGGRHRILTGLGLQAGDRRELALAIAYFDAAGIGFQVPDYAMDQFRADQPWDVQGNPADATIEGGHYVAALAYGPAGITVATWGKLQLMTWAFYQAFADEAWAYLSPEFLDAAGHSPDGLDIDALRQDIAAL